jgi:hypothetical protein
MLVSFRLLAYSFSSFFLRAFARSFSFSLVRSSVRSFARSFVVSERYCDKYLSRRRATLMRKKSKKPIDYLSFSLSLSLSLFSQSDCLLTVRLHYTNITTITDDKKQNKQK